MGIDRDRSSFTGLVFKIFLATSLFSLAWTMIAPIARSSEQSQYHVFQPAIDHLLRDGFDRAKVERIFSDPRVEPALDSVALFFIHSEARLDYDQFSKEESVAKAREYMVKYQEELARAEKKYGVDKEVITAILLVETRLGTYTGKSSILNTLATMASLSDPIRRETLFQHISNPKRLPREKFENKADTKGRWAYDQLKAFIRYTERESIDPSSIFGSYAGALGISQFMPSSIIAYAVDGDGDGRVDLFSHADAIASAANYLKHFGWRPGIDRKKAEKAVHAYNRSSYYVNAIMTIADKLGMGK